MFDIVIPVGPNDMNIIHITVAYAMKNIIGYRNIYLISHDPYVIIEGCITIPESLFPFDINALKQLTKGSSRTGWYLQQLLKLHAWQYIPNILNNYLVLDADTMFLRPTHFFDNDKVPLYNVGTEYHVPYFVHMAKLHPSLIKRTCYSGICHHMMFQRHILEGLFNLVEAHTGKLFWIAFMENVTDVEGSGASEYEIYFNFLHHYHPNEFHIRYLNWRNVNTLPTDAEKRENDYVSYHWYMR